MLPFKARGTRPALHRIEFVGSNTGSAVGTAALTANLTTLKTISANNASLLPRDLVIILWVATSASDLAPAAPSGWTKRDGTYKDATQDTNLAIFYKFMGDSPDASVTLPSAITANDDSTWCGIALRGVDQTTPFDVADVVTSVTGTSRPDPGAITPITAGAWIVVAEGRGGSAGDISAAFTNPGDLSSVTNHFRSVFVASGTRRPVAGMGIKTDWSSGAFDPAAFTGGGTAASGNSGVAVTLALRPA